MQFRFRSLAAAAPLFLIPLLWGASLQMEQRGVVEVRHHHVSPGRLPPAGSQYWITTPGVSAGANNSRTYNSYQSYGASPGQPGSPTYAPYAGLPPLRYYSN